MHSWLPRSRLPGPAATKGFALQEKSIVPSADQKPSLEADAALRRGVDNSVRHGARLLRFYALLGYTAVLLVAYGQPVSPTSLNSTNNEQRAPIVACKVVTEPRV